MPIQYTPTKYAFHTEGVSLTEPEHKDSCDINKMLKNAARGLQIRGGPSPKYGYDDTTLDAVQHRIQKEQLEKELSEIAQSQELDEALAKHIPSSVQQKFGFKTKKAKSPALKNDDSTTKKTAGKEPTSEPEPSKELKEPPTI